MRGRWYGTAIPDEGSKAPRRPIGRLSLYKIYHTAYHPAIPLLTLYLTGYGNIMNPDTKYDKNRQTALSEELRLAAAFFCLLNP
jgi:hypothetical protein